MLVTGTCRPVVPVDPAQLVRAHRRLDADDGTERVI